MTPFGSYITKRLLYGSWAAWKSLLIKCRTWCHTFHHRRCRPLPESLSCENIFYSPNKQLFELKCILMGCLTFKTNRRTGTDSHHRKKQRRPLFTLHSANKMWNKAFGPSYWKIFNGHYIPIMLSHILANGRILRRSLPKSSVPSDVVRFCVLLQRPWWDKRGAIIILSRNKLRQSIDRRAIY